MSKETYGKVSIIVVLSVVLYFQIKICLRISNNVENLNVQSRHRVHLLGDSQPTPIKINHYNEHSAVIHNKEHIPTAAEINSTLHSTVAGEIGFNINEDGNASEHGNVGQLLQN